MAGVTTMRRLGKRAPDPTRPVLDMGSHLMDVAFETPAEIDYAGRVESWVLGRNYDFGTCGPVSVANFVKLVTTLLADAPVEFTDEEIFDLYRRSDNAGFDPELEWDDPRQEDNGVIMSVMLSELVKNGIGFGERNVKAVAFGSIDPRDTDALWAAGALFGGVLWGADLDQAQDEQFVTGQPWDVEPYSPTWGGHAVLAAPRYSDQPGTLADRTGLVTWAELIDATNAFVERQVDEAYVVILPWHLGDRQFIEGLDLAAVAAEYEELTGRPFPAPLPAPEPEPAPVTPAPPLEPAPIPRNLLQQLIDWINDWFRK